MKAHRIEFPLERMSTVLGVSCSGYYAWLSRAMSARAKRGLLFDVQVSKIFKDTKRRYGRRRLQKALRKNGIMCTHKRVAASMRRQELVVRPRRKYIATTDSRHSYRVAPNLLERNFTAPAPNRVWTSDITYLPSKIGWLYLVVFLDLFSRMIVGWKVSTSLCHEPVLAAFTRAAKNRRISAGLIMHSDRGIQYCCEGFRKGIAPYHVEQSMSRKGDCWDNAVTESFFSTLKKEMPSDLVFADLASAERYLFEYIEIDYNLQRLHSTLGYRTPHEYESRHEACSKASIHVEDVQ